MQWGQLAWRRVKWVEIIGSGVATLVGGPVAVAIQTAVKIWSQLGPEADEHIGSELERSAASRTVPDLDAISGPIGLSERDRSAVEFLLLLLQRWHETSSDSFESYVSQLADTALINARALRTSVSAVVYDPEEIRIVCRDAGVDMSRISLQGSAEKQWYTVFEYLRTQRPITLLLLLHYVAQRAPSETMLELWWKGD